MTGKIKYVTVFLLFSLFSGCVVEEVGNTGYQSGYRAFWMNEQVCMKVNNYFSLMQLLDRYLSASEELRPELEDLLFGSYKVRKGEGSCWNINMGTETLFTIDTREHKLQEATAGWSLSHYLGFGYETKVNCVYQADHAYRMDYGSLYIEYYEADGTFIFTPDPEQGERFWKMSGKSNLQKSGGVTQITGMITEPLLVERKNAVVFGGQLDMEIVNQETGRSENAAALVTTRYDSTPVRCVTITFKDNTETYENYLFE